MPQRFFIALFFAPATILPAADTSLYIAPLSQAAVLTLNAPAFTSHSAFIAGAAGYNPSGNDMVLSPDGKSVYVAAAGVVQFDLTSGLPLGHFATKVGPSFVALSPGGNILYAAVPSVPAVLYSFNTSTGASIATVNAGNNDVLALAVSPDGTKVYLSTLDGLLDFNAQTLALNKSVSNVTSPTALAFGASSASLYVGTDGGADSVLVLDTATDVVVATIPLGKEVRGVAVSPDGTAIYAATNLGLVQISTATNQIVNDFDALQTFSTVTLTPDGTVASCVVGTGFGLNTPLIVSVNVASGAVKQRTVDGNPSVIRYSSNGALAYVLLSNAFDVDYSTESTNQITAVIPGAPSFPLLAASSSGNKIAARSSSYASNLNFQMITPTISIIDTSSHRVEATYPYIESSSVGGLALNSSGTVAVFPSNGANFEILTVATGATQFVAFPDPLSNLDVVISPDDSKAYVSVPKLCAIDIASAATAFCGANLTDSVQGILHVIAIDSTGAHLFALNGQVVGEYATSSLQLLRSITLPTGIVPTGIAYSVATDSVYVIATDQNTPEVSGFVVRIAAPAFAVQTTGTVSPLLSDLAISGDGTQLYLAGDAHQITILNGTTLAPVAAINGIEAFSLAVAN